MDPHTHHRLGSKNTRHDPSAQGDWSGRKVRAAHHPDPPQRFALDYLLGPGQPDWTDAYHQDLGALALATFRHFRPRTDPIPTFTDNELRSLPPTLTVVLELRP